MTDNPVWRWIDDTFLDLGRQFRWSYLPPLMIYLAAGVQGLTAIVGTFFIKDYLDLSAAFLTGLAFWAGIPWTLKMPLGHLVDLIWRRKALLVYLGAGLITLSILIMYGIIVHTDSMSQIMKVEAWFVIATLPVRPQDQEEHQGCHDEEYEGVAGQAVGEAFPAGRFPVFLYRQRPHVPDAAAVQITRRCMVAQMITLPHVVRRESQQA